MRAHAVERLAERYGVTRGGEAVIEDLRDRVLAGEAKFRRPLFGGRSEWETYAAGKRIRFVWDESGQVVVTVLSWWRRRGRAAREAG